MSFSSAPAGVAAPPPPGAIFALPALIAPPLAVFAPLAMAPLLALMAAALLATGWRRTLDAARPHAGLAAPLLLVALWAGLSALWSPIPGHSLFEAGRFVIVVAAGIIVLAGAQSLGDGAAARTGYALLFGIVLALALLQEEFHNNDAIARLLLGVPMAQPLPLARYDRGITVLLLLGIPAAAPLVAARRWLALAFLAIAIGVTVDQYMSHASRLAFAAALVAAAFAWRLPRLVAAGMAGATLFIAFVFPLLAPGGAEIARIHHNLPILQLSAIHRFAIWRFVSDRIAERPLIGWGMDSARVIPGGTLPVSHFFPALQLGPLAQVLPLHPHDAALQWRLELGLPGAGLGLVFVAGVLWPLSRRAMAAPRRALLFAYAAAAWIVAMLSFGAWQAWWLSTLWLGAALLTRPGSDRESLGDCPGD
jgi:O-antigen ligase